MFEDVWVANFIFRLCGLKIFSCLDCNDVSSTLCFQFCLCPSIMVIPRFLHREVYNGTVHSV